MPFTAAPSETRTASGAPTTLGTVFEVLTPTTRRGEGLRVPRRFTRAGLDPFDTVRWEKRASRIRDEAGNAIFELKEAEVPSSWSQVATDVIVSKYFRRAGVPQTHEDGTPKTHPDGTPVLGGETSAKQTIHRLATAWRWWGERYGYFASHEDATAFEDEMRYMLIHQMASPNSPQWFNTGLALAYGITGPAQGHWYVDQDKGELRQSEDAYTRSQAHACFIQSVKDSILGDGGIMNLVEREARIFKYGSGTGTNFSTLRAEGEPVSAGGVASGLMSWLRINDRAAAAIKSGGTTRRAAKMVIVDMDHPDVEQFIWWKANEEKKVAALVAAGYPSDFNGEAYLTVSGQNSNNTIRVTNEFLRAVETDADWHLRWRVDHAHISKTVKARALWRQVAEAAWRSADPGVQYDTTIQEWHTCPASGRINATNPCSEYVFLDETACNLASINLMKFVDQETGAFDIEGYVHAIRLWTSALEITVAMSQLPSWEIARGTYNFRTLGLGYANLGTLLMVWGVPYDSPEARAIAGALTAILTGESYTMSAEIAAVLGPFPEYEKNREFMLRVIRNHRRAAYDAPETKYEGLTVKPVAINQDLCPEGLRAAAHRAWDRALERGEQHGYRNAQVTVIAPTGTIGLQMDCDTTGVEPDFALVKFKKLAGGGYFKIVNQSVPRALKTLGYASGQIADIVQHITGTLSFGNGNGGPHAPINREVLLAKGFTDADIGRVEAQLPGAFHLSMACAPAVLGGELLARLGLAEKAQQNPVLNVLEALGFTTQQIEEANAIICGRQTIEGAPHLNAEHLPAFDCANRCGPTGQRFIAYGGHVNMLAAVQPFVSGSISKTINMPAEATVEDVARVYWMGWQLGLKANALYRDGSKLSQPLSTKSSTETTTAGERVVERIVEKVVERPHRLKLPRQRQAITRKVDLGGHEFYLTVGLYPDGKPGELFITMGKEGTFASGLADAFAKMVSIALQYGVPLENVIRQLRHMRFSPEGFTGDPDIPTASSVADFLARWLDRTFPGGRHVEMGRLPLPEGTGAAAGSGQSAVGADHSDAATAELNLTPLDEGPASLSPAPGVVVTFAVQQPIPGYGFTGDKCGDCGSLRMVKNGTCAKCLDCGTTTGCS